MSAEHTMDEEALVARWPGLKRTLELGTEELLNFIYSHPALATFRNSPEALLTAMDDFAANSAFLISVGADKARILDNLITEATPRIYLEIGCYMGYSAILAGAAMKRSAGAGAKVWSLELDPLFAAMAMSFVDLVGLNDVVKIVTGPAAESLKRLVADGSLEQVDVLLLDHVEARYIDEFKVCEELGLLAKGTTVVADNVVRPGAPEYREFVRSHPRLESRGVPALIWPGGWEDELEVSKVIA